MGDYGAHYRINADDFGKNHINREWAYAKLRLSKPKGIKRQNFTLHLKECEFRFKGQKGCTIV